MNFYIVFGVIIFMVVIVILIYRTPKSATAAVNAEPKTLELNLSNVGASLPEGLTVNEQLYLQKGDFPEIVVKAKGKQMVYQAIGVISNETLYNEYDTMRLRCKIAEIKADTIVLKFSY